MSMEIIWGQDLPLNNQITNFFGPKSTNYQLFKAYITITNFCVVFEVNSPKLGGKPSF